MKNLFFVILGLTLLSVCVLASFISLTTTMNNVILTNSSSNAVANITNSGDEAASNVKISLILPNGFSSETIYAGKVSAGGSFSGNFAIQRVSEVMRGSYSIAVLTEYQDANGYQFSSVSPNLIVYENPSSSRITGKLDSTTLGEKGSKKIQFNIMNRDNVRHDAIAKIFLPNEITSTDGEKNVSLGPNEEKTVEFDISNYGALIGSKYAVFAAVDYESDRHYSVFSVGMIEIVKEDYTIFYIAIVAIIALIILAVNLRKRLSKPRGLQ
jgi:hypothetical protein